MEPGKVPPTSMTGCSSRGSGDLAMIAMSEIQSTLRPKIADLIQRQRLGYLTAGSMFAKYSHKGQRLKDKYWFCRLSPNQESLFYRDCDGNAIPETKDMSNKFPISEIKELVIGKDCPHLRDTRSRKGASEYSFCLIPFSDQDDALHFVTSDEKTFCYWIDGVNVLLKRDMSSKEAKGDMESLLSMHMAIQLLDMEGVSLPEKAPQVPPLPPNFDFALKY